MSKAEFVHTARDMKPLLNPRYAFAADVDGRTVAFMLAVPDYSAVLQRIGNGRLFPTGALRLLLGKRGIRDWRVMALGLRREYRTRGILPLFAWEAFRRGRQAGEQGADGGVVVGHGWSWLAWRDRQNVRAGRATGHGRRRETSQLTSSASSGYRLS